MVAITPPDEGSSQLPPQAASIAVPVVIDSRTSAPSRLAEVVASGADMVELRADRASPDALAAALEAKGPLAAIVTTRPTWEGGGYDGDEATRLRLFDVAFARGAEFVDVELAAWEASPELRAALTARLAAGSTRLILSSHALAGSAADLDQRLARLRRVAAAHVLKLAWNATSILDGIAALRMTAEHRARDPRPLVAIAMGEEGAISRLLGAKVGAPFTFARLAGQPGNAPGQPTVDELLHVYHWRRQCAATAVFGIAGWPVAHSLSPAVHNAGFDAIGFDGVYLPLPIAPGDDALFAALDALLAWPPLNLRGLSITSPHKAGALRYVDERRGELDMPASRIGAINTLVVGAGGVLNGFNSDAPAALEALCTGMGVAAHELRGRRVAVIGAGGAAAAVVAALVANEAEVAIYSRSPEAARRLASRLGARGEVKAAALDALPAADAEILINCTPVGMAPQVDASPLPAGMALSPRQTIFDTVYNPAETKLLATARLAGATAIAGREMFVRQAAIQFDHFTCRTAPTALFRRVVAARLDGAE